MLDAIVGNIATKLVDTNPTSQPKASESQEPPKMDKETFMRSLSEEEKQYLKKIQHEEHGSGDHSAGPEMPSHHGELTVDR